MRVKDEILKDIANTKKEIKKLQKKVEKDSKSSPSVSAVAHIFHLLVTVLTGGLWGIIWVLHIISSLMSKPIYLTGSPSEELEELEDILIDLEVELESLKFDLY